MGKFAGYSMGFSNVMIFMTLGWGSGKATLTLDWMFRLILGLNAFSESELRDVPKFAEFERKFGWLDMETWLPLSEALLPLKDYGPTWLPLSKRDSDIIAVFRVVGLP